MDTRAQAAARLQAALEVYPGGQAGLARALDINTGLVSAWANNRRPIAAHHCPHIERETGIRCEDLRPDLTWTRNEQGVVTGHHVPLRAVA